jgi:hypothetical protein
VAWLSLKVTHTHPVPAMSDKNAMSRAAVPATRTPRRTQAGQTLPRAAEVDEAVARNA